MFHKIKLLEIFHNLQTRFFNTTSMSGRASKIVQFNSGGDDFCPCLKNEGLSECVGGNPADGIVFAWRDDVTRKAQEGEKRLYSLAIDQETKEPILDEAGNMTVAAELHLKNDGTVEITGSKNLNIVVLGDVNLSVSNLLNIEATSITSSGVWVHGGNFTAAHIEADDGMNGVLDKPSFTKGIATGGS